jgi:hypothetical protein
VRRVIGAWRALRARDYAAAFACGAIVILVGLSEGSWAIIRITPRVLLSYMLFYGLFGVVFRLALAAADAIGARRWRPYVVACVGASAVCAVIAFVVRATAVGAMLGLPQVAPLVSAYSAFFSPLVFGSLTLLVYVRFRDHHRAACALRDAQRAASEARRKAAELGVHAANEALNPAQVVRALREIEALYESDAAAAGGRLDALALELRAAIPRAG